MKSLRKSWGVKFSGFPLASVSPVPASAAFEQVADPVDRDGPVLDADLALEQQRHRRVPDPFVDVVGDHQRHRAVVAADPADDRAEDVGQLGRDDQQPLGIGLGRGDLQQRDQLAGGGQPVLDEAVVRQFCEFLDPDAGEAENLHGRPGPERAVLFEGEVAAPAGGRVLGPHLRAGAGAGQHRPAQRLPGRGEHPVRGRWPARPAGVRRPCCGRRRRRRPGRAGPAAVPWSAGPSATCGGRVPSCGTFPRRGSGRARPTRPQRAGSSTAHWAMSR